MCPFTLVIDLLLPSRNPLFVDDGYELELSSPGDFAGFEDWLLEEKLDEELKPNPKDC